MTARKFVDNLTLELDVTKRSDCPVCGGKHTFSVTKTMDGIKWFCFSASCNTRGIANSTLSADDMAKVLGAEVLKEHFVAPEYWVSGLSNPSTVEYLQSYNILDLCKEKHIDVRYDPRKDRHVFINETKNGNVAGAYGRSNAGAIPKWFNYSETEIPYVVRSRGSETGKTGCIVEDPVSAAAVSRIIDGIALLGTYLKRQYIPTLREYEHLFIALDKDAGEKSLDIQRELGYYTKVDVVLLERDLKYMSEEEIREVLHG